MLKGWISLPEYLFLGDLMVDLLSESYLPSVVDLVAMKQIKKHAFIFQIEFLFFYLLACDSC